jgi:hypothetical protein
LVCLFVIWLVGRSVGWLVGWLVCLLVSLMVSFFLSFLFVCRLILYFYSPSVNAMECYILLKTNQAVVPSSY